MIDWLSEQHKMEGTQAIDNMCKLIYEKLDTNINSPTTQTFVSLSLGLQKVDLENNKSLSFVCEVA